MNSETIEKLEALAKLHRVAVADLGHQSPETRAKVIAYRLGRKMDAAAKELVLLLAESKELVASDDSEELMEQFEQGCPVETLWALGESMSANYLTPVGK